MPPLPSLLRGEPCRPAAEPAAELAGMSRRMLRDILGDGSPSLRFIELRDAQLRVRFGA
jgi:hypothetical protein